MSLHAVNILGINITNSPKKDILEEIKKYFKLGYWGEGKGYKNREKPLIIVTPNPEQIVLAQKNSYFAKLLNRADVAIPDGVGLVWASSILSPSRFTVNDLRLMDTIPGIDLMEELVAIAAKEGVRVALIGGGAKIAVKAFECLRARHSSLQGIAMEAPEFEVEDGGLVLNTEYGIRNTDKNKSQQIAYTHFAIHDSVFTIQYSTIDDYFSKVLDVLQKEKIGMVFVALGAPKQEMFMENIALRVKGKGDSLTQSIPIPHTLYPIPLVLMSVGGSLDEISGTIPRAPGWVSRMGIKWLWRLLLEPWRLGRQLALWEFIRLVVMKRFGLK